MHSRNSRDSRRGPAAEEMPAALWAPALLGTPFIARTLSLPNTVSSNRKCQQQQEMLAIVGSTRNSKDFSSAGTPEQLRQDSKSLESCNSRVTKKQHRHY